MRWGKALVCAAIMCATGAAAQQERRVYTGSEAAALRCAGTITVTAVTMERAGVLATRDMEVMLAVSGEILRRHVSGTNAQKQAAMETVVNRRDLKTTLQDFRRYADTCIRQFPI